jgi:hypothetical protein
MNEWSEAHAALDARIRADEQFPELVRSYGGNPASKVPSRRARRLADRICERLALDPAIWRGNVYGAAADYIRERSAR